MQQPLHRALAEGALRRLEEADRLDLLDAVDQPPLGAVAAMVVLGEDGLGRVAPLEHARGVGDAGDDAHAVGSGVRDELAARLLFQQVVDDLHGVDRPVVRDPDTLIAPADRGPERHADRAHRPGLQQAVEVLPQRVVLQGVHAGVVQLVEVDLVAAEAAQALLQRVLDERRRPVVRTLHVSLALPRGVDVVAELRADDDVVVLAEGLLQQ